MSVKRYFIGDPRKVEALLAGRPASQGVRYTTLINTGKTYKPNGNREAARRAKRLEKSDAER